MISDGRVSIEEIPVRIGLIGTGLILFDLAIQLWSKGQAFAYASSLGLSAIAWIAAATLIILAMTPHPQQRWTWLILVGLVFVLLGHEYIYELNFRPLAVEHPDNVAIAEFGVQALKRGLNPYSWNFSDIQRVYYDRVAVTPFLDGATQNRITYPALQIIMLYVLNPLGIQQARELALAFHVILLILLFVGTRPELRAIVLLPLFILGDFGALTLGGTQDVVWSVMLVAVILLWRRPIWRAIIFGLACSFRQQPWLVAPFILIYLWNEGGSTAVRRGRIALFGGVSLGVFLLVNLTFIVWDPHAWWFGVFEPVYARFDVISFGLGALSQFGIAPLPREFYLSLQVASLLIMLVIHWRHPKAVGEAFWLFPAIFFWLYYRGLTNYWIYWIPPLLLVLTRRLGSIPDIGHPIARGRSHSLRTAAFAGVLLLANLALGFMFVVREPAIDISSPPPFGMFTYSDQLVNQLKVRVRNGGNEVFTPRFAIQQNFHRAIPWDIGGGPHDLAPGQTGEYIINTSNPADMLSANEGGQIVVTDAGGDYGLRAILDIPPDPGLVNLDLIANPTFSYWHAGGNAPRGWELRSEGENSTVAQIETVDGVDALTLRASYSADSNARPVVRLSQTISFPDSFTISVYPTATSADPTEFAYGLELNDGKRRLWILFGDSDDLGMLGEDFAYIFIRSPLNAWSKPSIELQDLYMQFGWPLPDFTQRVSNGMEFQARQVDLSLLSMPGAGSENPSIFGPIEQNGDAQNPRTFVAEALEHPDTYYVNVGDEYRRQRNFGLAQDAYLRALTYNALSPGGSFGLAESSFWLGDYDRASKAFVNSIQKEYRVAESYRGAGWSALALGDVELSEHFFRSAIEADPNLPDAHNGLGWVFIEQDFCEQAVTHFRRALSLDSRFLEAQRGIEECALREDI